MSRHLEITDLPSDINGTIPGVRHELITAYNNARGNETKMDLLRRTLNLVIAHVRNDLSKDEKETT